MSGEVKDPTRDSEKQKLKPPRKYAVLLINDDFTTFDFVTAVLETIFNKTHAEAQVITREVHEKGVGVAGVYTYEIAETKAHHVELVADKAEHPLRATLQQV